MQCVLLLCLICACAAVPVHRAEPPTTVRGPSVLAQPALQEDVNVLVYGVLQLSQTLHDTYINTGRRLQRVNSSLSTYNLTLSMLGREALRARQSGEQLKRTVRGLQVEEKLIQRRSASIQKTFDNVLEDHLALKGQVRKLEQRLNGAGRPAARQKVSYLSRLKGQTEQQNFTLQTLMAMLQHQQQQMTQQGQQLSQIKAQIENHREIS